MTISEPKRYQPSEWAAGAEGPGTALRFTVVVVNGTEAPYDVVGDYVTLQSGNKEAEQIFDSEKNVTGPPDTKILPDREAKYDIAFQVKNPKDLVMEYQPVDWELTSVIFVS